MDDIDIRGIIDGSSTIAQIVANYYLELIKCGFTEEQALEISIAYQSSVLGANRGG